MEQMLEFVGNHPFLGIGFLAIVAMIIKTEYESRTSQSAQVNPMNAIRLINNNDDALVVDVRDDAEFAKGHIKGASNMPISTFKDKLDSLSKNKDSAVLAYCASGSVSGRACRLLTQAGYSNVHNISGGINAWIDAKLPITKK